MQPPTDSQLVAILNKSRPDKTKNDDHTWWEPIILRYRDSIPIEDAQDEVMRRRIAALERKATRRTNKLMREINETGQYPLHLMDAENWPLSVGDERVALRAVTEWDLAISEREERESTTADFASRMSGVGGRAKLRNMLIESGSSNVADFLDNYASQE